MPAPWGLQLLLQPNKVQLTKLAYVSNATFKDDELKDFLGKLQLSKGSNENDLDLALDDVHYGAAPVAELDEYWPTVIHQFEQLQYLDGRSVGAHARRCAPRS